uniref:Uncharacterized protein n=1 Tax=Oryza barthii TaxID=65489 RepID=A0A0D3FHV8_9ORYZ
MRGALPFSCCPPGWAVHSFSSPINCDAAPVYLLPLDHSRSRKAVAKWAVDNLGRLATGYFRKMNVQERYWINPDKMVLEILHAESRSKQEMAQLLCQNFITL